MMLDLTKREELVLLSVCRLSGNAYIVTVRKCLAEVTGQSINYGSLCNTLSSLVRKGMVDSRESAPKAKPGGRRKVLYTVTREGKEALKHAYEMQKLVWEGMDVIIRGVK